MNTEVSTRRRGTRQPAAGRPQGQPAKAGPDQAGDGAPRRLAVPGGTAGRPAGPQPGLRSPASAQPALRRPAAQPVLRPPAGRPASGVQPAAIRHVPRTRFILLVLGLLGSGMICLLVINTTLAAASFRIDALQRGNAALAQQEQALQQQVTTEESATSLEQRALKLGMRTQPLLNFLNVRTGHVYRQPASVPGVPNVPGYAP